MKFRITIALLAIAGLVSCKRTPEDPPSTKGTLQVNFTASFNGQPMVLNSVYSSALNYRIKPETVKYLLHHFQLKRTDGSYYEIREAVNINHANATNGFSIQLEPANYTAVKFGLGVDASMNNADPNLLPPTHPFSTNQANDLHWNWSTGYIFAKFEGRADTSGTGSGNLDRLFFFHPGANTLYGEVELTSSFGITTGQTRTITIDLDVNKLITNTSDTIDLKYDYSTHTNDNYPLAERFILLMRNAFSIQ